MEIFENFLVQIHDENAAYGMLREPPSMLSERMSVNNIQKFTWDSVINEAKVYTPMTHAAFEAARNKNLLKKFVIIKIH